jgi:hypothetical protein
MSYTVEKLPNEPIVVCTFHADFKIGVEGDVSLNTNIALLDKQTERVYYIVDCTYATFNLDDAIQGANMTTRQKQLFKHPKIIESIFVTQSRLIKLVVQGLNNPMFGSIAVHVVDSLNAALAYARSQAAAQQSNP